MSQISRHELLALFDSSLDLWETKYHFAFDITDAQHRLLEQGVEERGSLKVGRAVRFLANDMMDVVREFICPTCND